MHEIDAGDALTKGLADVSAGPDDAGTIGRDQISTADDLAHGHILAGLVNDLSIGGDDVMGRTAVDIILHDAQGLRLVDAVYGDS